MTSPSVAAGLSRPAAALRQGSAEWLAARRQLVTSTDLPVILGLSPYKSEATLAREKLGLAEPDPQTLVMRVGLALEPVIREEYERQTGVALRRFHGMVVHPQIEWAAASPDWRRQGARYLVEGKYSTAARWAGGLPQDVEAQVRWALGCTGYPIADVARLDGRELHISDPIEHDQATFDGLVAIAADFRRRLAAGGPFAEDAASIKARYPTDDGTEVIADAEVEEAVRELLRLRALAKDTDAALIAAARNDLRLYLDLEDAAREFKYAGASAGTKAQWQAARALAEDKVYAALAAIEEAHRG